MLLTLVVVLGIVTARPEQAYALDAQRLINYFVNELTPYGRWSDVQPYGRVWEPTQQNNWQPYTQGHWRNSEEYGWVWIPQEQWGDITHHYGRWGLRNSKWFWVPDDTWGPAWVDWRQNDQYVGWAPLQPDSNWNYRDEWRPSSTWHEHASNAYTFVPQRYFAADNMRSYILPRSRTSTFLGNTRNITVYRNVQQRIINEGPPREVIERAYGGRIERAHYAPRVIHDKELVIYSQPRASFHTARVVNAPKQYKSMHPQKAKAVSNNKHGQHNAHKTSRAGSAGSYKSKGNKAAPAANAESKVKGGSDQDHKGDQQHGSNHSQRGKDNKGHGKSK